MRRVLAILLALAFGLGPFAAFLDADQEARLPVCCRRHGTHHCAMPGSPGTDDASGSVPAIGAPAHCPLYPGSTPATTSPIHPLASAGIHAEAPNSRRLQLIACEAAPHINQIRTHSVRGPPATHNA
jgi:hypothetical protein